MQIDSVDWRPNFSVAAVGWCESHLTSPTKLFTQSACWHVSFKTPKLLQVFSPRIRPLVYFRQVIWHCACELCLIYKQVNGNERLGLTRALSKPFAVSLSLYSLTSKHQPWGLSQSDSSNVIVSVPMCMSTADFWLWWIAFYPSHPPNEKGLCNRGNYTTLNTFRWGSPKGKVLNFFLLFGEQLLSFLNWLPNFAELELLSWPACGFYRKFILGSAIKADTSSCCQSKDERLSFTPDSWQRIPSSRPIGKKEFGHLDWRCKTG